MISKYQLVPNSEHYAITVDLLGRMGELNTASDVINDMPMQVGPDIWGASLDACCRHQNMKIDSVMTALDICGVRVDLVTPDEVMAGYGWSTEQLPEIPRNKTAILWAGYVLPLFKNINTATYQNYMNNRISALSRLAHMPSDASMERPLQQTLIYPELPVVYDRQLRGEIVNFFKAAVVIINCRHPQFFRYYGDLKHHNLLHMSIFPVLIALAIKLKFETNAKIVNQFQAPTNIDPGVVDYLAKLHNLL
ncbi:hypothetical protein KIW84_012065 [Lathyrus oleraceus]|uniref:Pentatricopeptide repeat-containing protein n=1 Tax=Pisum sativum TaxID=3888 RepID=A0A9D5BGP1_PEA|nr:hypothetical protein KIW84_012065 [Pisum sativum]